MIFISSMIPQLVYMAKYFFEDRCQGFEGGNRQIRTWVNQFSEELSESVIFSLRSLCICSPTLTWVSPLQSSHYASGRDCLNAVNLASFSNEWVGFWPIGGSVWEALAVAELDNNNPNHGVVLVAAKSHITELCGNGCRAEGADLKQIKEAFRLTRQWLGVADRFEDHWLGTFHQTAARLAFLYFLHAVLKVPTWLVNIYFLNDPRRPTSPEQWSAFLPDMQWALGLSDIHSEFIAEFYLCSEPERLWVKKCRD